MAFFDNETQYFLYVIKNGINGTKIAPPSNDIDWQAFFDIAKKQEIFSLISTVMPTDFLPTDFAKLLNNHTKSELVHILAMKNELSKLETALKQNDIHFMLLKGAVIRDLYPKQLMRQMSDVDIMYNIADRDKLLALMQSWGYTMTSDGGNSDDFSKQPYYTFEFHHELFKDVYGFCPDFSFVWERASVDKDNDCKYIMSMEDVYLHSIAHMYKHYVFGGFGVRFLIDTYLIINKNPNLDFEYINTKLAEMDLTDFELKIKNLSNALMSGNFDNEQAEFIANLVSKGIYGNHHRNVDEIYNRFAKQNGNGSTFSYVLRRIFPTKEQMQSKYPVLLKKPYLLLFYYIKRLFTKMGSGSAKVVYEAKQINSIKNNNKVEDK